MSFQQLVRKTFAEPWAIMPEHLHGLIEKLWDLKGDWLDDWYGIKRDQYQARLVNEGGLGVIRIPGAIGKGLSGWELMLGAVDVDDLIPLLRRCGDDKAIRAVFLDVDSPGGTMCGVPELSGEIVRLREKKPVLAYTDQMMCSAAYCISAGATAVYSSASAYVGSIGVMMPILDYSKHYEAMGVKQELFVSGPLKGAGYPGTALTPVQREYLQRLVDDSFMVFSEHVKASRLGVKADVFSGGVYHGVTAQASGLVDSICDRDTAKADAMTLAA